LASRLGANQSRLDQLAQAGQAGLLPGRSTPAELPAVVQPARYGPAADLLTAGWLAGLRAAVRKR
jgi:hypothetical protein